MLIHSLLWLSHQSPPDMRHGVPDTCIGVILIPVQLGHQLCNVRPKLFSSQLSNGSKTAQEIHNKSHSTTWSDGGVRWVFIFGSQHACFIWGFGSCQKVCCAMQAETLHNCILAFVQMRCLVQIQVALEVAYPKAAPREELIEAWWLARSMKRYTRSGWPISVANAHNSL